MDLKEVKIVAPVLFLVFNRPEKTKQVFDVIRSAKPAKLYVAGDAPRNNNTNDIEAAAKVKEIVGNIDWECDVKYLFHQTNLGCSLAGKTAWDWIFSQEEEMIFIEDDGLIDKSFFAYCQVLLDKYRHDNRIAYIGGVNYGIQYGDASYFFSRISVSTYSMATWKRTYQLYEFTMESYLAFRNDASFIKGFGSHFEYKFLAKKFDKFINSGGNTYDLQMVYLVYKNKMFCIHPNINFTTNIGFDNEGTNTNFDSANPVTKRLGNRARSKMQNLIHPQSFTIDPKFERKYFRIRVFYGKSYLRMRYEFFIYPVLVKLFYKVYKRYIKPLLN